MNNTFTIKSKDVKSIILATFPDYKKRKIIINVSKQIQFHNLNWSGGSRNTYKACTIDGKFMPTKVNMNSLAPWNNQFEGLKIDIPRNVIIVQHSYFCGKETTMTFFVNPDNIPTHLIGGSK